MAKVGGKKIWSAIKIKVTHKDMSVCHGAMMSSKQEDDGEYKLQDWSLSKWNLLLQTREAGQDRNSRAEAFAQGRAVGFLLKRLGGLSAAP